MSAKPLSSPDSEYHTAERPAIRPLQKLGYALLDSKQLAHQRASPDEVLLMLPGRLREAIARLHPTSLVLTDRQDLDRQITEMG